MPKFLITWTEVQEYSATVEFDGDENDAYDYFQRNIADLEIKKGDFCEVEADSIKVEEIE